MPQARETALGPTTRYYDAELELFRVLDTEAREGGPDSFKPIRDSSS